jgi:hypothetical protein
MVILPPFLTIADISVIGLYCAIMHSSKKCQGENPGSRVYMRTV